MSLRVVGCLVLILIVIALRPPLTPAAGQQGPQTALEPVWEYRVLSLDSFRCNNETAMTQALNGAGREGWELVGYQPGPVDFPSGIEGTILIRPAATGAGKDVQPQLADSFQGNIKLGMQRPQVSACRLVFKREAIPAH